RQDAHVSEIHQTVMRRTICAYNACAIQRESHIEMLHAHVVIYLVKSALKERRIDRSNRFQPLCGHSGAESNAVFFGNSDIKGSSWKLFHDFVDTSTFGHR